MKKLAALVLAAFMLTAVVAYATPAVGTSEGIVKKMVKKIKRHHKKAEVKKVATSEAK